MPDRSTAIQNPGHKAGPDGVKWARFPGRMLLLGFGSVGQGSLPLILRHIDIEPQRIAILSAHRNGDDIARKLGVSFELVRMTSANFEDLLAPRLSSGDFLVNASNDVSSVALLAWCQAHGVMYIDASLEPWEGVHGDPSLCIADRTLYHFREQSLALRRPGGPTALTMHGANPGLVSHFVKQALLVLAQDHLPQAAQPASRAQWAALAQGLGVKVIQVSERDGQISHTPKAQGEFVNTWSPESLGNEAMQAAELGWGSHERVFPARGRRFDAGSQASIYLEQPGALTRVRSWAPLHGSFHGWLIPHGEAISIADYLTVGQGADPQYRPTCYYAYHPCNDAVLSMNEFIERNFVIQERQRLLRDELTDGIDELGVMLMGHAGGAYWFGSQLSVQEARALCPYNNATTLQVNSAFVAAIVWVINNPGQGLVEPDELPHDFVMTFCRPYLGRLVGTYTDWTPLKDRSHLFSRSVGDPQDPWQFDNFSEAA